MHKQHPQTAYRKDAVLIGTIFENCDRQNSSLQAISPQFSCGSARIKNKGLNFNCQNGGTIMAIFEKTI